MAWSIGWCGILIFFYAVKVVKPEVEVQSDNKLIILNEKLMKLGIDSGHCTPGQYYGMYCPKV